MNAYERLQVPGRRLGRHVAHDERSRAFPAKTSTVKSVRHKRLVPIFDQGELGSCTGNALAGCLSTEPFSRHLTEADAVRIYSAATHLDRVRGVFPPTDTGSSGLAVCKAAKAEGLIEGYRHAFGLDHVLGALSAQPGILGIGWKTGCDMPDAHGIVRYEGYERGGHEVELQGIDLPARVVWLCNSWGESFGVDGYFGISFADLALALANHGDVTFPALAAV